MPLPFPPNVLFVAYRSGNTPPADPDVPPTPGVLQGAFERGQANLGFTHMLLVDVACDLRDDYDQGVFGSAFDDIYVPDAAGTRFRIRFLERVGRGTSQDHKRVFLDRYAPIWPTNEV